VSEKARKARGVVAATESGKAYTDTIGSDEVHAALAASSGGDEETAESAVDAVIADGEVAEVEEPRVA
jgi:hypothetical protein